MDKISGVSGNTYGLMVDTLNDRVLVGNQVITEGKDNVRLFTLAYRLGRDHKKTEIRNVLSI